jgi:uncharacterized membrane protein YagU involved in acid resistance
MNTAEEIQFRYSLPQAILGGGLLAAFLEILPALIVQWNLGVTPVRVFQSIASGFYGKAAYQMGMTSAAVGVAVHIFISIVAATLFVLASRRMHVLAKRTVLSGIAFGLMAYAVMNWVVVPLSAIAYKTGAPWPMLMASVLTHVFLFGVPIAFFARASFKFK